MVTGNKKKYREFDGRRFILEPATVGQAMVITAPGTTTTYIHLSATSHSCMPTRLMKSAIFNSGTLGRLENDHADVELDTRYAANNLNGAMARNAKLTVVEV